jgi:hypothetical protein
LKFDVRGCLAAFVNSSLFRIATHNAADVASFFDLRAAIGYSAPFSLNSGVDHGRRSDKKIERVRRAIAHRQTDDGMLD